MDERKAFRDEVEALVAGGVKVADAVPRVAAAHGMTEREVRDGIYAYSRALMGPPKVDTATASMAGPRRAKPPDH